MEAKLLIKTEDSIGEGATWLEASQSFLWVDIDGCTLNEYSCVSEKVTHHTLPDKVSTIIPTQKDREIILAVKNNLICYNLSSKKQLHLQEIFPDTPMLRTNDGKASPEGRIWLGVMHMTDHHKTGALYRIDKDLTVKKILEKQSIPNGIVWNKTGEKMYYVDSGRACIEEYDYEIETGDITFCKVAVSVPVEMGVPDGMTIDDQGRLWVAHWGGFGVYIWDPTTGKLLEKISVPVPNVASCTFGGTSFQSLYITTACAGLSANDLSKYPLSGSVFTAPVSITPGVNHYVFRTPDYTI